MVQLRTECMFQYDNKFMTHYNSVVYLKYFTVIRKPSFPPRIKYGVNSSGNPASKIRFPRIKYGAGLVELGMTPIVKSLLRHYTISCVIAKSHRPWQSAEVRFGTQAWQSQDFPRSAWERASFHSQ
jgi:hypothetical protein